MSGYTKAEALAFIDAMRLALTGKVGFKWLVEKLSDLAAYIETITTENARLTALLDRAGGRDDRTTDPGAERADADQDL